MHAYLVEIVKLLLCILGTDMPLEANVHATFAFETDEKLQCVDTTMLKWSQKMLGLLV